MTRENIIEVDSDTHYSKSNFLISAKFSATLIENKLTALCLYKLQNEDYIEDEYGRFVCKFNASQLKKLLNTKSGSFYKLLDKTAQNMTSRTIGFSNPESKRFEYISIIDKATYSNGVFMCSFSPDVSSYIKDLKSNFTILNIETMLKFKKVYAFRIYELLLSRAYRHKDSKKKGNKFIINFNLSEFKLEIGAVNSSDNLVQKALAGETVPDYDKAISKDKKYSTWYDFKKVILEPSINEINKLTDIHIDYDLVKTGKGGKVTGLIFEVYKENDLTENNEEKEVKVEIDDKISDEQKFEFYIMVKQLFIDIDLSFADISSISKVANYNTDTILNAKKLYDNSNKSEISNVVGWLIAAIKNDYKLNESKVGESNSKNKTNSFNNFNQRKYDYEQLEMFLLNTEPASK